MSQPEAAMNVSHFQAGQAKNQRCSNLRKIDDYDFATCGIIPWVIVYGDESFYNHIHLFDSSVYNPYTLNVLMETVLFRVMKQHSFQPPTVDFPPPILSGFSRAFCIKHSLAFQQSKVALSWCIILWGQPWFWQTCQRKENCTLVYAYKIPSRGR